MRFALSIFFASLLAAPAAAQTSNAQPIVVKMMAGASYGIPPKEATNTPALVRRAVFEEFHRQNPDVRVENAGGLTIAGELGESMFLMSMAGDSAPDVFYVNFRQYYTFLDQGFCRPLDDLVAQDPSILRRAHPMVMDVIRSYDGHTYAIPFYQVAVGLFYRKDHFREAGLDPNRPPKNWDEFYRYAQKLTQKGRSGFAFSTTPSYHWQNFVYQAGGEVVAPTASGRWQSKINSPEAAEALAFYRKMVTAKWPGEDGKPQGPAVLNSSNLSEDIRTGKTSMWFSYVNDVVMNQSDLSPSVIGIAALPAGPKGQVNEINAGMWAINSRIKDPAKLAACWRFIQFFAGNEAARVNTKKMVELGLGNLVNPTYLEQFGYRDLLATVDPSYVEANRQLFTRGHPEPYGKNCQQVYTVLNTALDQARLDPNKPEREILREVSATMDQQLLGFAPKEIQSTRRAWALGILLTLAIATVAYAVHAIRRARANPKEFVERLPAGIDRRRVLSFLAICLAPAALSLAVWSYYPLGRGLIIAFQDYRVMRPPTWVGLDNFIDVFTQPIFYKALGNSFIYVGLSLLIGFFIPVLLALALNEIPRFKVLFRTLFYLPAMTSSMVVALLWRQLYDKTDSGILNSLLAPIIQTLINPLRGTFGFGPLPLASDWLGDPRLAMFAVVLPGIWAGAGPGSILYLAALKNISEERYEAADIDGANWRQKIWSITLPGLKPLILINLLGVFIGGFKAMENVFVLTQGGPLNSTRTIGLEVWQYAFMYLKFGYATAAAWVMGAILIGFTLIQIRTLLQMRFSTAKT
ncbi:MAG: extracellular solute-binding protein [Fimbriimonas sp.]